MKNLTTRLMIAAATLAAAAVSASAQTYTADVPMTFSAGGKLLAAGAYDFVVSHNSDGHRTVVIRNHNTPKTAAMLVSVPGSDAPKAWRAEGLPRLTFNCLGHACSLNSLYNGRDVSAYQFPQRKASPADAERIASVTVALVRSE